MTEFIKGLDLFFSYLLAQEQRLPGGETGERRRGPPVFRPDVWLPQHSEPRAETQEGEVALSLCGSYGLSIRYS